MFHAEKEVGTVVTHKQKYYLTTLSKNMCNNYGTFQSTGCTQTQLGKILKGAIKFLNIGTVIT